MHNFNDRDEKIDRLIDHISNDTAFFNKMRDQKYTVHDFYINPNDLVRVYQKKGPEIIHKIFKNNKFWKDYTSDKTIKWLFSLTEKSYPGSASGLLKLYFDLNRSAARMMLYENSVTQTLLCNAIELKEPKIVQVLLEYGADPNEENSVGDPLINVIQNCYLEGHFNEYKSICKALLLYGARLKEKHFAIESNGAYPITTDKVHKPVEHLLNFCFSTQMDIEIFNKNEKHYLNTIPCDLIKELKIYLLPYQLLYNQIELDKKYSVEK